MKQLTQFGFYCAVILIGAAGAARAQQTVAQAEAACAKCHAEIVRGYLRTPMANASGPASERLIPGSFTHAPSGVRYAVANEHGQAVLHFTDTRGPQTEGERRLDSYLGSGHLGLTYLYSQGGYLLESPVAWYASTSSYDMKPGFGALTEMPPALPMEPACLRCHMSRVAHALPGTVNRYNGPAFAEYGIGCGACHGDAAKHVESGGKAPVVNPAKLDAERRDAVCMSCHLEGDVAVEHAGRSAVDYKPGERLAGYLSFFVFPSKDPLARGVSETEQFAASRCKLASGDRMSCTSCHDPHNSPADQERAAFYRGKCLACHGAPEFARTHHPEQPACTGCHMPQASARNIPHVAWTDHRILKSPSVAPAPGVRSQPTDTLQPIFSPLAGERDLAVARYEAVLRGKSQDREGALAALKQAYADGARDPVVLEALGVTAGLTGDAETSKTRLKETLAAAPDDLTAIADLGVLLAREGRYAEAVALWKPALARNEDLIGLARNLAAAECAAGDSAAARQTMATAIEYSPGVRAARAYTCAAPK